MEIYIYCGDTEKFSKHYDHSCTHGWVQSALSGTLQILSILTIIELQNSANSTDSFN